MLIHSFTRVARAMRVCAPAHSLRTARPAGAAWADAAPAGATAAECGFAAGEACCCGWHLSSYELRCGLEVMEEDGLEGGELGAWADAISFA